MEFVASDICCAAADCAAPALASWRHTGAACCCRALPTLGRQLKLKRHSSARDAREALSSAAGPRVGCRGGGGGGSRGAAPPVAAGRCRSVAGALAVVLQALALPYCLGVLHAHGSCLLWLPGGSVGNLQHTLFQPAQQAVWSRPEHGATHFWVAVVRYAGACLQRCPWAACAAAPCAWAVIRWRVGGARAASPAAAQTIGCCGRRGA